MAPVVRFICHFLVVWLTLLSGGAHAIADARHDETHAGVVVAATQAGHASVGVTAITANDIESTDLGPCLDTAPSETCHHSHCGHGHTTGIIPTAHISLTDASRDVGLAQQRPWVSGEFSPNIERPKWSHTTPAVVNL